MPKIIELDPHVADLIAAGEVVERPASVVKELMENSVDAGAGIITIEISAGGMTYIRISDNGCGISPEDVKTAFLRHATSKLKNAEGLEAIGTLGFRGEALAAIAAVSRIELLTREQGAKEGVSLMLEAGNAAGVSPAGCPEGTTIIVRDLFFNTPARLKFMKSDRAEGIAVASAVLRGALARPDVSVRFIKDGKTEYHTPGDSKKDSCIYSLFGRDFFAGLLSADASDEVVSVTGFISSPDAARGNRSYQYFFVNGRPIKSMILQAALEKAYENLLHSGRFPSCVLYITTKLGDVDVNVHPAKTEVKFVSDKQVFDGVYYAALSALERGRASVNGELKIESGKFEGGGSRSAVLGSSVAESTIAKRAPVPHASEGGFKSMNADEFRNTYVSNGTAGTKPYKPMLPDNGGAVQTPKVSHSYDGAPAMDGSFLAAEGARPYNSPSPRVIGEAFKSYIIAQYNDSVWFIDKHAAHERLHFNALKNEGFEPMSQALITPVICKHGLEDVDILLENSKFLDSLGFAVESFGEDAVAVRRIPSEIDIGDTEAVLSEICALMKLGGTAEAARHDDIFKTIACKAAVKAGHSSDIRELESLAKKVFSGEASHCPHGRPVFFEVSKAELEKRFKRG